MDTNVLKRIGEINNTSTSNFEHVLDKVMSVCTQMLFDRGYTLSNSCKTINEIKHKMENNDTVLQGFRKINETINDVIVYFHNEERVGVKQLRTWYEKNPEASIIILSLEGPTAFTKKEAESNYKNIQFFLFKHLCVNITKHKLVPKHEKVEITDVPFDIKNN